MSGRKIQVVNSNGSYAGTLYHKERFTYSFDLRTINGEKYKKIWFLNSHGSYGISYILNSAPIKNWDEYLFSNDIYSKFFKIDRKTGIYNSNGERVATANPEDICKLQNRCQTGATHKNLGLLLYWISNPYTSVADFSRYRNYFIDTGVSKNSGNTAVYGDWN